MNEAGPVVATARRKIFSPDQENIEAAIDNHFQRIADEIKEQDDGSLFAVEDAFGTLASYWINRFRLSQTEREEHNASTASGAAGHGHDNVFNGFGCTAATTGLCCCPHLIC
jgi:hypothetical protein